MANAVVHWEIGGRDLDALGSFYRDLFGWEATTFGVGSFALYQDPEGNTIGILQPVAAR